MPNKLSQFWQELKRRRVIRIVTVYVAAAFVILELVSIIVEPLKLPEWTLPFIIVLLCVGFIIAVILSWIYDIHPDGGIVKTEPVHKVTFEDIPKSSNSWKIASYISFVVIVGLIVLNTIPRNRQSRSPEILDKSIAVLPFNNLSTDEENTYFIDGVMESILDNLCKIKDLRVPGSTSVIQYRENPKPIPIVAEEMDVTYVLEGSGQKIGNRLFLTIQLIIGNEDRHIWSKQYDRVIEKVEDLDRAVEINPNSGQAHLLGGELYAQSDFVKSIQYYHKALTINRGGQLPSMLNTLGWVYLANGFIEKSKYYYNEAFKSTNDSLQYYQGFKMCEFVSGNFSDAIELLKKTFALDSTDYNMHSYFGEYYMMNGDHVQSLWHFMKWLEENQSLNQPAV
jgi:TolB-like protein